MAFLQISVFLENRSGQLSDITKVLSDNGIDIKALNIAETADYGILRIITANSHKTIDILKDKGFLVTKSEVVAAAVPNRAGGLNDLLQILAENNIDIEYMYSIFGLQDGLAYMIFKVSDVPSFEKVLNENNIKMLDKSEIGIE